MIALGLAIFVPLALAARLTAGRWLHPGAFFAGYWLVAAILPLVFFDSTYTEPRVLIYIAGAVVVFTLGALMTSIGADAPSPMDDALSSRVLSVNRPALRLLLAVGIIGGLSATILVLRARHLSLASVLSVSGLLDAAGTLTEGRYVQRLSTPALARILLGLNYTAALLAPFTRLTYSRTHRLWTAAPTFSLLCFSLITTEKYPFILGVTLTAAGYIGAVTLQKRDAPRITAKGVGVAIVAALVLTGSVFAVSFVRNGVLDVARFPSIRHSMNVYAFGYESAYSAWLKNSQYQPPSEQSLGWGSISFAGVDLALRAVGQEVPTFPGFVMVNDSGQDTNIYTAFAGLQLDFGTSGAVIVLFVFGMATGAAYRSAVRRSSPRAAISLACCYSLILGSNTQSMLMFTNVSMAMLLAVLVVPLVVLRGNPHYPRLPLWQRPCPTSGIKPAPAQLREPLLLRGGPP